MSIGLKHRLKRGERLVGTILSLPSPEVAEILSRVGFDWLFVDMEHGGIGLAGLQGLLQAADPRTPCLVRSPEKGEVWAKKCLDSGAAGIIVPRVNSAKEAAAAVHFAKYPPQGCRSVGISRAHGYGADFEGYLARANDEVVVVLQIEHIDAVERIDSIVQVPGIDALFVGHYDLSASMGRIGQVSHPAVREAMDRVMKSASAVGMPLGIFAADTETGRSYMKSGYQLIAVGMDGPLLAGAAGKALASMKG